jgi:hypothetical protein
MRYILPQKKRAPLYFAQWLTANNRNYMKEASIDYKVTDLQYSPVCEPLPSI